MHGVTSLVVTSVHVHAVTNTGHHLSTCAWCHIIGCHFSTCSCCHKHRSSLEYLVILSQTLIVISVLAHGVTNTIDTGANKQCFAPNLLRLKLIKCSQRNWSRFKQTLKKKSLHKPSASYTVDRFEKRLNWCCTEQKPGAQQATNSATQLYFCVKFLKIIKLFLDTPVQGKHEDFIK